MLLGDGFCLLMLTMMMVAVWHALTDTISVIHILYCLAGRSVLKNTLSLGFSNGQTI